MHGMYHVVSSTIRFEIYKLNFVAGIFGDSHILGNLHPLRHILGIFSLSIVRL